MAESSESVDEVLEEFLRKVGAQHRNMLEAGHPVENCERATIDLLTHAFRSEKIAREVMHEINEGVF